jgi:hypothetical protein
VSIEPKSLREYLTDWFANLAITIRAALSMPLLSDDERAEADRRIDPDFIGWVHNDPMVTGNPASRYYDDAPGYLTRNGRGSLEIGRPTTEVRLFLLPSGRSPMLVGRTISVSGFCRSLRLIRRYRCIP